MARAFENLKANSVRQFMLDIVLMTGITQLTLTESGSEFYSEFAQTLPKLSIRHYQTIGKASRQLGLA